MPRHCDQPVNSIIGRIVLGKLAGSRQNGDARAVLDQKPGEETRIQPGVILKSVDGGVFGDHSEIQRRVTQREVKIDQQGVLACLLGHGHSIIACQRGDAVAALGP